MRLEFSEWLLREHKTLPLERTFENSRQMIDFVKLYVFAYTYRSKTIRNERGVTTACLLVAEKPDGQEVFIGNIY